eukprot:GHUV01053055.1.p2 GENE.GHUV01053055.1~~GHUV01053055.1.p2  ORF type:complete len:185 (+),score=40.35 GHUV01053055.1:968-1522(+)
MCKKPPSGPTPAPAPGPAPAPNPGPGPAPGPAPGGGSVSNYITSAQWDQLFPNRNAASCQGAASNFYNYNAFVTAAAAFPGFGTSSTDPAINKRELAAFLGQISHETTGGWSTAPGGPYAWGLCFITEGDVAAQLEVSIANAYNMSHGGPFDRSQGPLHWLLSPVQCLPTQELQLHPCWPSHRF